MLPNDAPSPLHEWNRLARENAENAIVSSMFEATAEAGEPLEAFSGWLLLGTAAVASFMVANSEKVVPLLGQRGFLVCGALLCLSCAFGLMAKFFAVRRRIGVHLAAYDAEEEKIKQHADATGITLQTGIRIDRVLGEYLAPWPKSAAWLATRYFRKNASNPQIAHLLTLRNLLWLGGLSFLQALSFLAFLASGFLHAAI
jgi:hypothetical protein